MSAMFTKFTQVVQLDWVPVSTVNNDGKNTVIHEAAIEHGKRKLTLQTVSVNYRDNRKVASHTGYVLENGTNIWSDAGYQRCVDAAYAALGEAAKMLSMEITLRN